MEIYYIIIILATLDIVGRIFTLLYLSNNNNVKVLSYRNWALLVAFVNFAFIVYWIIGRKK